jgi:hypothetical protein
MSWRTDGKGLYWNTDAGYDYVDWPFNIHTYGFPCSAPHSTYDDYDSSGNTCPETGTHPSWDA